MFTYVKLVFLIVLVGIFYWRDLAEIWQTTFDTGWTVFTLVIFSLIVVFLFQRRKPLKTLVLISENDNKRGSVFLCLALILYVIGSYTSYALWIHLFSLLLFVAAYLMLIVDRRIPRMLFLPFVALLLIIPPTGIETFEAQNLLSLVATYFIASVILLVLIVHILPPHSKWRKSKAIRFLRRDENFKSEAQAEYCPLCQSDRFQNEKFCPHCGRQRIMLKPRQIKPTLTKFLILSSITIILSLRVRMINWWNLASLWTIHMSTFNEIYMRFKDVIFAAAGVAGVFLLAVWVRTNDDERERLSENAFFLLGNEADLFVAVSMIKRRRFSGAELFEAYTRFVKSDMDLGGFYERMNKLLKRGLLEREFVLWDCELRLIWKSRLP